jgi:flavodoxin
MFQESGQIEPSDICRKGRGKKYKTSRLWYYKDEHLMKTLIVYTSVHHQNTEKVAKVMAEAIEAELITVADANPGTLAMYGLIGFGSGIYFGKHHKTLLRFVESLPPVTKKRAFVFSTSGDGKIHHNALKERLVNKGYSLADEFCCKGWDTVGPLKLFGGINKGRPDQNDLAAARAFAEGLKNTP